MCSAAAPSSSAAKEEPADHLQSARVPGYGASSVRRGTPDNHFGRSRARLRSRVRPIRAASWLREGMAETLPVTRLGLRGRLRATSLHQAVRVGDLHRRATERNAKRWRDGEMRLGRTAAGMPEGERQFRRVKGHRELPMLIPRPPPRNEPTEEAATVCAS